MTRFAAVVGLGVALFSVSVVRSASAEQFVAWDLSYEHSWATTRGYSHHWDSPSPQTPMNLVSPVDYSKGTVHYYMEVFTKPSAEPTYFHNCFGLRKGHYVCGPYAPRYTTIGIYQWSAPCEKFSYYNDGGDWSSGLSNGGTSFIITNAAGNVGIEDVGMAKSALYLPTKLRVVITFVSPGGTYVPPTPSAGFMPSPVADAGVKGAQDGAPAPANAPDAAAAATDAAAAIEPPVAVAVADAAAAKPEPGVPGTTASKKLDAQVAEDPLDPGMDPAPVKKTGGAGGCSVGSAPAPGGSGSPATGSAVLACVAFAWTTARSRRRCARR